MTVARIRGAQMIRGNSETSEQRSEGLLPVAEDWHAKMCFLEVRIIILFLYTYFNGYEVKCECVATCNCTVATYGILQQVCMF